MTKKTKMRSKRTSRGLERTFHTTIAMATKTRMTYKVKVTYENGNSIDALPSYI